MLKQFLKHCDNNCLLPDFQSAYQANYSTETSLVKMTNDILWAMERAAHYNDGHTRLVSGF